MKIIKLEDFKAEATKRFGSDTKKWKLQCPSCKTAQSAEDFAAAGVSKEDIQKYIGFSCIGRFTKDKGCDWTLGGLLHIHEVEIEIADGTKHMSFDLAPHPNINEDGREER